MILTLLLWLLILPNPQLTPGDVMTTDLQTICTPGYSRRVRDVSQEKKRQVYRRYGMKPNRPKCCEVDHLIPLCLGGSNDLKNLWPEEYIPKPGALEKDKVELWAYQEVCSRRLALPYAQKQMAKDWTVLYKQMKGVTK